MITVIAEDNKTSPLILPPTRETHHSTKRSRLLRSPAHWCARGLHTILRGVLGCKIGKNIIYP